MSRSMKPDGIDNFVTAILFIVVDTLAVILRVLAKLKTKRRLSSDDYWMFAALVFYYGWAGLIIYSVAGIGGTLEAQEMTSFEHVQRMTKILWVASHIWPLSITPLKISILCFYRSVFPLPWFKSATYILTTLCVMWWFSGFWVILFQCSPVRAVYDYSPSVQAKARCVQFGHFVFFYELLNACLDVAILALPALVIPKLQLSFRRKVQVMLIFLMGGFVLVTCVLRMVYTYNPKNPKLVPSFTRGILWATIEGGVAIICGNLPTYRPLFPRNTGFWPSVTKWYSSLLGTNKTKSAASGSDGSTLRRPYHAFNDEEETSLTNISGPHKSNDLAHHTYALDAILVDRSVDVQSNYSTNMDH